MIPTFDYNLSIFPTKKNNNTNKKALHEQRHLLYAHTRRPELLRLLLSAGLHGLSLRGSRQPVLDHHVSQRRQLSHPEQDGLRMHVHTRLGGQILRERHTRMQLAPVLQRRHMCRTLAAQHQMLMSKRLHRLQL